MKAKKIKDRLTGVIRAGMLLCGALCAWSGVAQAQTVSMDNTAVQVGQALTFTVSYHGDADQMLGMVNFRGPNPEAGYIQVLADGSCRQLGGFDDKFGNDVASLLPQSCQFYTDMTGTTQVVFSMVFSQGLLDRAQSDPLADNHLEVIFRQGGTSLMFWTRALEGFAVTSLPVSQEPQSIYVERAEFADECTTSQDAQRLGGLEPGAYQRRVTGACPVGAALAEVYEDGTVRCASLPSPEPTASKVITPSTLGQVSLEAGDAVVLRGTFTADQALDILQTPHLQVYGGTLQAQEGTASLSLGQGAQLYGVTFDGDFNLSGMETSFQRCYFINGRQQLPSGAQINQSVLRDVVISADTTLGWLNQLHVERAELPSFQSLTHSLVVDSSIGTGSFQVVRDNKIMRSFILMDSDGAHFVDNHCDQSFMTLPTGHSGSLVVRGNKFQGLITGEAQLLHIGASGSQARTVSVENNHFWMQSGQYGIQVTGDVEGSFKLATLSIQGNHFYRGAGAVEHTSNLYTLISSNILRDTPMGTSATSSRFVQNNASF